MRTNRDHAADTAPPPRVDRLLLRGLHGVVAGVAVGAGDGEQGEGAEEHGATMTARYVRVIIEVHSASGVRGRFLERSEARFVLSDGGPAVRDMERKIRRAVDSIEAAERHVVGRNEILLGLHDRMTRERAEFDAEMAEREANRSSMVVGDKMSDEQMASARETYRKAQTKRERQKARDGK
jgi:hypothetical protein